MRKMSSPRGFTLPEVLVTVTIVAVLAAVMVPAVINQVAKGDVPSVAQDLGAIRTAITTFAADTRRFPKRLTDLTGTSLLATDKDFLDVAYGGDAANYRGPYLPTVGGAHTGPTGGVFADTLGTIATTNYVCLRDDTISTHSKVSLSVAKQIDLALDGAAGNAAGVVRYSFVTDSLTPGTLRACVTTR